jgi:hypothetical protein
LNGFEANFPEQCTTHTFYSPQADLRFQLPRPGRAWLVVGQFQALLELDPGQAGRIASKRSVDGIFEVDV